MTRMSSRRPAPFCRRPGALVLALLVAALSCGCAAFPHGAYWPSYESRLTERAAAERGPDSATSRDLLAACETPAERATLQKAVTRRWSNDGLAESARNMDARAGRWVYADAMRTVVWFYVDPVTYSDPVAAGIRSLRAARRARREVGERRSRRSTCDLAQDGPLG